MNIEKELKESVKRLLKKSSQTPIYELECIIGNINRDFNKKDDMINILKRIKGKSRFARMTSNNSLLISFPKDNNIYNSITKNISRVVINGNGLISNYAKTNNLKSMIEQVIFENKSFDNISKDKLIDDNLNLRFNLKKEEELDVNNTNVINLVREWKNIDKYFRKKSTYTFYEEENDFKIDISIISSSKKFTYSKTLQESKVLENKHISYEFEIEYIGNKKEDIKSKMVFSSSSEGKSKSKTMSKKNIQMKKTIEEYQTYITDKFFDIIKIIMRAKQQSLFVLGSLDKQKVNNSFRELVGNDEDTYLPNVVDLEPSNVLQLPILNYFTDDYDKNIRMDYAVTDKADGTRYILFIDKDGKCYFKGRDSKNNEVNSYKYTGTVIKGYANSIFDGELIDKSMDGKFIQNYYIFDAYIVKGVNMTSYPFGQKGDTKSRYHHVVELEKYFETSDGVLQEDDIPLSYLLKIFKKNYYYGNMSEKVKLKLKDVDMNDAKAVSKIKDKYDTKIFESIEKILKKCNKKYGGLLEEGHMFSYPLDGLIFQPVSLGVNQNKPSDKNKIGGTWKSAFRWKPPHELTIDFMVKFNKVGTTNFQQEFFYKNKKYIQGTLFCKMWKTNYHKQMMAYKLINNSENFNQYEEDYPFSPLYPYNGKMESDGRLYDETNQIYLLVDGNGKVRCQNGEFINDGDTVECGYDLTREDKFRWTPMKIRANKTPNSYMTALGAWKLINNPISVDTIMGLKPIENTYYYYNKQTSNETSAMRKFNNFVKREIIQRGMTANTSSSKNKSKKGSLSPKSKYNIAGKSVLDLASGKMGDFIKYCLNGADKLVGIDISPDNIFNLENGAATRIMKTFSKDPQFKKLVSQTIMILGDCSKSMSSGEAAADALNKYYLDIIYGKIKPKKGKLARMSGIAVNGFDLVVCNFAIHYMFNTQDTLDTFLQNVKENLAKGGYFVGSCLDGVEVAKALGKKEKIEGYYQSEGELKSKRKSKKTDNSNNKLIWSIKKVNPDETIFKDSFIGQKVSVYMDTFFDAFEENLVNMDFLVEQCNNYGLELVDSKLFIDTQDNLFNEFKKSNKEEFRNINNNVSIKEWLSFQRWFIFQKVKK